MNSKLILTILFYGYVNAQDGDCNFIQQVTPGFSYWIEYPEYPRNYNRGRFCRWIGICETGYNCRIECTLSMPPIQPPATTCTGDRVLVSRSGDQFLTGAETYCGSNSFTLLSLDNRIVVGLVGPFGNGRFRCRLSSQVRAIVPNCRCGEKRSRRIVGGVTAEENEYPMMAGILDSGNQICGGVIINRDYILTAAHCIYVFNRQRLTSDLRVVVGNYNINRATPYVVSNVIPHPNYNRNSDTYDYDACLMRVASPFQFSVNVGPVCLPFPYLNNDLVGQPVTLLGWGLLDSGEPPATLLQEAEVSVVPLSRCLSEYPQSNITQRRICTFALGRDSCQMDSGGPVLYYNANTARLFAVGIISSGDFCATSSSSVNTRVTAILNWILSVVQSQDVCVVT